MQPGQGVLLVTNAVEPSGQTEFDSWYIREHLPERVGQRGFLRGRRFRRISGSARFMALYETESPAVLQSREMLERLNNPTPWTQRVMPLFRDMHRSVMRVVASHGTLDGGVITLFDLSEIAGSADALTTLAALLPDISQMHGICSAHLWQRTELASPQTVEQRLRGAPDHSLGAALGIEGTDEHSLEVVAKQFVSQLPPSAAESQQTFRMLCTLSAG